MIEILFRGKRLDNGEWVKGAFVGKYDPLLCISYAFIIAQKPKDSFVTWYAVDPNTVGQYTGLCDKNGTKIFEGDVVKVNIGYLKRQGVVFYEGTAAKFGLKMENGTEKNFSFLGAQMVKMYDVTVIGNIHDNPDLLKGE